jgi:hypothetical protein
MGKAKKQTVGYKYYMGVHMGIGRGPIDEICEIRVGDRKAWEGSVTENKSIRINAPKLFGGEKGEGGIDGQLDVMLGGATQTMSSGLRKMLKGKQSQFRGVTTTFFDGMICAMSPYPKAWKYRVRRILQGWDGGVWYPEKAVIEMQGYDTDGNIKTIRAMNPAHIIYEAITNRAWGLGRARDLFLEDTWRKAADQLYDENFGLCLRWGRQDTIMSFVQTVIDHIAAAVYVDKFTGLYKIKLIRDDYDPDTLPVFDTDSGLLSIDEATNTSPYNLTNEIVVAWHNPITDEDAQQRAHNLALIQTQGALSSDTRDYPGIPTARLALWIAKRDLKSASTNVRRFTITCDRRAWRVQPGDVLKLRDPESRGLETVIVRVGSNEEAGQADGKIKIVCVQDMFGIDLNTFGQVQPPAHVEPDNKPALARRLVYETPYAEMVRMVPDGELAAVKPLEGYIHAHAEKPTPISMAFDLLVRPEGSDQFIENGGGDFTPLGELNQAVMYLDKTLMLNAQTLSLDFDWDELEVGMGLAVQNDSGVAIEMLKLEGWDAGANTITVGRGSMDTIPHRLFAGWTIWISHDNGGSDSVKYLSGEAVDMKILPWTLSGGRFPEGDAPTDRIVFAHRQIRPLPMGNLTVTTMAAGTAKWYAGFDLRADIGTDEVPDMATFRWAHRDRIIQQDVLVGHEAGDIGPEPGQTYRLRVFNNTGQLVRTESGIAGTQFVYTYEKAATDTKVEEGATEQANGTIFLDSMREGFESWQYYTIPFSVHKKPPQEASVADYNVATMAEPAAGDEYPTDDQGGMVSMMSMAASQDYVDDGSDGEDNQNINVAQYSEAATQATKIVPPVDFYLYEAPYLTLARDGLDKTKSQMLAFVARPSDRLTDAYDFYDKLDTDTDFHAAGAGPWTPWGQIAGFVQFLSNEIELKATSDTDGVPITASQPGDLILVDNELMKVESIDGKRIKVGRGSADTIPAAHYAGAVVWLFDRNHSNGTQKYGDTDLTNGAVVPHTYSQSLSTDDVTVKQLQMKTRPRRPYPPGLMLANGKHWYEQVDARADNFDNTKPQGKDVVFSWAHRNRILQDVTAYDHFASGIRPEEGLDYRVWIGYVQGGVNPVTTTLLEYYTADAGFILTKAQAESIGETAGRALKAGGQVYIQMAINARRDGLFNWQGYTMDIVLPSYPLPPGEKPGGNTQPPTPNYPDPGSPDPNPNNPNPTTPGDGDGNTDPTPDPNNPDPNPDPEVPGTEPPQPPEPPQPDPDNVYGWSIMWDHGWAADLPNQTKES